MRLRDAAPGGDAELDEVIEHCRGKIATYKIPRYLRVVDEWPMSGTKIQKFRLREQIAAELADAGVRSAPKLSRRDRGASAPRRCRRRRARRVICSRSRNFWILVPDIGQSLTKRT